MTKTTAANKEISEPAELKDNKLNLKTLLIPKTLEKILSNGRRNIGERALFLQS